MGTRARMNLLWNQVRQSERVCLALHAWHEKPKEERTYQELIDKFRTWITEQKSYENFLKMTGSRASAPEKPTLAPVTEEETRNKKKRNKKKKKDSASAAIGDNLDSDSSVAAMVNPGGKGAGKSSVSKPKGKCMNFQKKWGAKGCECEKEVPL